jgi:hypothetical protein
VPHTETGPLRHPRNEQVVGLVAIFGPVAKCMSQAPRSRRLAADVAFAGRGTPIAVVLDLDFLRREQPVHGGFERLTAVLALGRELLRGILFRELRRRIARSRLVRPWWQRARKIISEGGFSGLFAALKKGVALPVAAFAPLASLLLQQAEDRRGE